MIPREPVTAFEWLPGAIIFACMILCVVAGV